MPRALAATAALAAVVATGCSPGYFIVGGQIHKTGAPPGASVIYTPRDCQSMTGAGTKAVPEGGRFYLDRASATPSLYGLDARGHGVRVTNHWADAEGDHFFFYVKTSIAGHFVFPKDPTRTAVQYAYDSGTWSTTQEGGVIKPLGAPAWKCPMIRQPTAAELEQQAAVASRQQRPAEATRAPARASKHIIAVFTMEDRGAGLAADVQERLSDYLASTIAASGKFQVIPRSLLKERLGQQKTESYKTCYDQSCQIELGKELAAEKSLSTQVIRLGQTCSVTAVIYDLKTAASEGGASSEGGCSEDELARSMKGVVAKITGAL